MSCQMTMTNFVCGYAYNLKYTDSGTNDGNEMSELLIWILNFYMNTGFQYW